MIISPRREFEDSPNTKHLVRFDYCNTDGQPIHDKIKKPVAAGDVTITFIDTFGLRWRRTGNSEPIRVVQL